MSLPIMARAWASGTPPIDRLVLVALADWANERGQCWPSMPVISGKTGVDVRTARRVMARLEAGGHITTERRPGKGILYTIHPGQSDPGHAVPGQPVPRTESAATPDTLSPNTPRTTIKKKASPSPSTRAVAVEPYPMPDGTDPQAWADFLANRKRKRLTNTATAHKSLMDDLARHATDAWPPARLIAYAAGKGWGSVRNPERPDDARRFDRARPDALATPRRGFAADMLAAAHARPPDDPEGDPRDSGGTEGEVPAWLRRRP